MFNRQFPGANNDNKSNTWASSDIKNILHSGNILYNSTGKVTTLLVSDLPKYIKLYNFIYHIQELHSLIGDIFVDNESFNLIAFSQLEHVIVKHKYLILVIGDSALSIIYSNTSFYVFDPHK